MGRRGNVSLLMKRIVSALCLCGCECCEGECVPTSLFVTFAGCQNANCLNAALWHAKWELVLNANCVWEKANGLPCNGTLIGIYIDCPSPTYGVHTVELEVSENGVHVGSFYLFSGAADQIDCRKIGLLGAYVPTAAPRDEVDWSNATATVTDA